MRILVISDIHANLPALETVLADARGKWDHLWCLGDIVGYGPNPNECVALLQEHDPVSLTGNHDWAALGKLDISDFNTEAQIAVRWTQAELTAGSITYLDAQPPKRVEGRFTLAHGSPRHPVWEYILDDDTAAENFDYFSTQYCLVGHTHVPMLYLATDDDLLGYSPTYRETLYLDHGRVIINPGSVGQPRDSDPRAAYALLDTDALSWEFHRVDYPIHQTQEMMRKHGLPTPLVMRLEFGW